MAGINSIGEYKNNAGALVQLKTLTSALDTRRQIDGGGQNEQTQAEGSQSASGPEESAKDKALRKTLADKTTAMEVAMRSFVDSLQDDTQKAELGKIQEAATAKAKDVSDRFSALGNTGNLQDSINALNQERTKLGDDLKTQSAGKLINPDDPAYRAIVLKTEQLEAIQKALGNLKNSGLSSAESDRLSKVITDFDGSATSYGKLNEITDSLLNKNNPLTALNQIDAALQQTDIDGQPLSDEQVFRGYQRATGRRGSMIVDAKAAEKTLTLGGSKAQYGSGIQLDAAAVASHDQVGDNQYRVVYKDGKGNAQKGLAYDYRQAVHQDVDTGRNTITTYVQAMNYDDKTKAWIAAPNQLIRAYTQTAGKKGRESGLVLGTANERDMKQSKFSQTNLDALNTYRADPKSAQAVSGIKVEESKAKPLSINPEAMVTSQADKDEPADKPTPMTHEVSGFKWVGWDKGLIQATYDKKSFEEKRKENAKAAQTDTGTQANATTINPVMKQRNAQMKAMLEATKAPPGPPSKTEQNPSLTKEQKQLADNAAAVLKSASETGRLG